MFKNFDDDKFKENLANSKLEEVLACTDANEAAEMLLSKLTSVLDEMAPIKTIQTRSKYAPWLSQETKDLQSERNAAQEKASISDNPEDWRLYRSIRNQVIAKSRADHKDWERRKLDDKENSPTELWKTVKSWLGWGGGGTPTQLFAEGKMVTSPGGLSGTMNKFFLDKVRRLRGLIPAVLSDPLAKMKDAMKNKKCIFRMKAVSVGDVLKVIKKLKNSTATGVDYIDS